MVLHYILARVKWNKYKDEYQNNLKDAINNKIEGKNIKGVKKKNKKKINDLMEALEKSLKVK